MTTNSKTIAFTQEQLFMVLDAMEGFDAAYQFDGDEQQLAQFDKLYKRILTAYQKFV